MTLPPFPWHIKHHAQPELACASLCDANGVVIGMFHDWQVADHILKSVTSVDELEKEIAELEATLDKL